MDSPRPRKTYPGRKKRGAPADSARKLVVQAITETRSLPQTVQEDFCRGGVGILGTDSDRGFEIFVGKKGGETSNRGEKGLRAE